MKKHTLGILLAGIASWAFAGINDDLQKLGTDAAKGYLKPIVSTLGADLNQGWFREAPKPELFGLDISAKVVAAGTMFNSDAEQFSATTTTNIDENVAKLVAAQIVGTSLADTALRKAAITQVANQLKGLSMTMTLAGPTIIGPKKKSSSQDVTTAPSPDEITYTVTSPVKVYNPATHDSTPVGTKTVGMGLGGVGQSKYFIGVPAAFPQLTIGTLAGTQLAIRYCPTFREFSFFGFGISHNPGFWFDQAQLPLGINSSVTFAYSSFNYGDYMKFSGWNAGLQASRRFGFRFLNFAPYVGVGVEKATLEVSYLTDFNGLDGKPIQVNFSSTGENFYRATAGLNLRLGVIDISGDYTLAKYTSASVGLGLGF